MSARRLTHARLSCRHIAREIKAYCLFATHFHELTDLEREACGIGNLHVAVQTSEAGAGDDGSRTGVLMLYEVRRGASTQSYGINTARAAAFPPELVSVSS